MNIPLLKRLVFCMSLLDLSVSCIYATHEVFVTSATSMVRRSLSINLRRISSIFPSDLSTAWKSRPLLTTRFYSDFNHNHDDGSMQSLNSVRDNNILSPDSAMVKDILDKILICETFLFHSGRYLQETKDMVKTLRGGNNSNQIYTLGTSTVACDNMQQNFSRTLSNEPPQQIQSKKNAVIIPVNQNNSNGSARTQNDSKGAFLEHARDLFKYSGSKESFENEKTENEEEYNQDVARKVRMIQDDFMNRIISACKTPNKVDREDLRKLLDLYAALADRAKDAITKVLNRQIETPKSSSYRAVVAYAQSKQSNIETYREIYTRLFQAFDQDVMVVIYIVLHSMMKENAQMLTLMNSKNNESWSKQDYISFIVLGANPLYPVTTDEVKLIMDLYAVNFNIPKDAITKVLNGDTDTTKSAVYRAVLEHAKSIENLEVYRNIYARLSKSLNEQAMPIIYRMIKSDLYTGDAQENANILSKVLPARSNFTHLDPMTSHDQAANFDFGSDGTLSSPNNNITLNQQRPVNNPEEVIKSRDGKYTITKKEQARLSRIYALLPEFHGKSITMVLSGETKKTDIPAWSAVRDAIEQIRQEAVQEGDYTPIDLNYFRKLYWASIRVTGSTGVRASRGRSRVDQPNTHDSELNDYLSSLESEKEKKKKRSPKEAQAFVSKAPTRKKGNGTKSKPKGSKK